MGQRPDQLGSSPPDRVRSLDASEAYDDDAAETAAAREEIERTRADMTSTIEAIQDKLDPEVLSEQAKDTAHDVTDYAIREAKDAAREVTDHAIVQAKEAIREVTGQAKSALREATIGKAETMVHTATETAGGWRQTLVETVKEHPLPAAVAGLSIGWLFLNRSSGASRRRFRYEGRDAYPAYAAGQYASTSGYGAADEPGGVGAAAGQVQARAGQAVDRAHQTAAQVIDRAQETAGQVLDQVQDTSSDVVDQVQERAARAQGFLASQLEENPLLVGAVAAAIGGVLAATVRPTEREDQLLGGARDRLVGSARELTQETMQKVGQVMDEAQSAAKQEAKEQSLLPDKRS